MSDRVWQSNSSNDVAAAGNYSGGVLPVTADRLLLNSLGAAALSANLPYYTNVLGFTLDMLDVFAGQVGLEGSGTNLASYLKLGLTGTTNAFFGRNGGGATGGGSTMVLVDGSTGTLNANVYKTGGRTGSYPPLCLIGTNVRINAYGGDTGFAVRPGESGTLLALNLLALDNQPNGGTVRCGRSTTFPASVRVEAGTLYSASGNALTTLFISGSKAVAITETDETGALTNIDLSDGGKFIHKGTGTLTSVTVRANCTLDLTQDAQAKAVQQINAEPGSTILLDNGVPGSITHPAGGTNSTIVKCTGGIGTIKLTAPAGMALSIQ